MADIATLSTVINKLSAKDQQFASDLIRASKKYGSLTAKQEPWVDILIARATKVEAPKVDVGNFAGVIALFTEAKKHLKYPKITLMVGEQRIVLSLAGTMSKCPGCVNITDGEPFGMSKWFGRISPDGSWTTSKHGLTGLEDLLKKLARHPAKTAMEYGKLTGHCCFCAKHLEEAHSVAAGFGPVCAKNYGLTEQWKSAVAFLTGETPMKSSAAAVAEVMVAADNAKGSLSVKDPAGAFVSLGEKHLGLNDDPCLVCRLCGSIGDTLIEVEGVYICPVCAACLA